MIKLKIREYGNIVDAKNAAYELEHKRFLCKTQNVKDAHGKHILLGVTELAGYMMNESIDFDILCDGLYKLKELAESGIKTAEKKIDSDLFENIQGNYDLIIFNPPYFPEDAREPKNSRLATTGGKKGNEIILNFLKQAKNYLKIDGKIFLITSSLAEDINFKKLGYHAKEIGCEKLFFERLCIWELII